MPIVEVKLPINCEHNDLDLNYRPELNGGWLICQDCGASIEFEITSDWEVYE